MTLDQRQQLASPSTEPWTRDLAKQRATCRWLFFATFGFSLLTLGLFASAPLEGAFKVYAPHNLVCAMASVMALGIAFSAAFCLKMSMMFSRPHLRITLLGIAGCSTIALLYCVSAISWMRLADELAILVAIGLVPSLLTALVALDSQRRWEAFIPYPLLALMAFYSIYCGT